jgi:hypothetical protein
MSLPLVGQDILKLAGADIAFNSLFLISPQSQPLGVRVPVLPSGGSTVTLAAKQTGSTCLLDSATGVVYTLPAPVVGLVFDFVASVAVTSNAYKIVTDAGTTFLVGGVGLGLVDTTPSANAGPKLEVGNGSSHVAVTMNGSTTGGLLGTTLRFTCIGAALWNVSGIVVGSGTIATPFATS